MLLPFMFDARLTPDIYLSVIDSRMLPSFISDRKTKSKHPTFISVSYEDEWYRHWFSDANDKHPTFILYIWRVLSQNTLSAIFDIFKVKGTIV